MATRVARSARAAWLAGLLATALAAPALAASETTADRLLNAGAEPENWLTHHKDYAATRYSTLDQITKDNVKDLRSPGPSRWAASRAAASGRMAASRAPQSSRTASSTSPTAGGRCTSST